MELNDYMPLRDVVFKRLRDAIITGELEPGTRLMEIQLAEKMGVSRTPIREAIRKLELEGLIVMIPRKGAHVANFTAKDIEDVLEIRAALEALSTRLACNRLTNEDFAQLEVAIKEYSKAAKNQDVDGMIKYDIEFHDIICKATGNEKLVQMFANVKEQVERYRVAYLKNKDENVRVEKEHREILKALKERNGEKASKLTIDHIHTQCDKIIEYLNLNKN